MHLFYTPDIEGNYYLLDETESKHCIRVLRLKAGDRVNLIDGKGGFYLAKISVDNPKKCIVEVVEKKSEFEKRNHYLHIAIAPTKNIDRFEWFLEKATEIGIDEITPILCQRSERKNVSVDRMEKIVISAIKQSVKAYLPKINELTDYKKLITNSKEVQKYIAHCDEPEKEHLFNKTAKEKSCMVLIGPEGDFSPEEISLAKNNGFEEISLGKSRLRTETAGVAACQIVNLLNI
ncbi:MAG: 16S rRNA (uracil(1498)-N(3))-methyltransferase [Bacteroidetes bacterium GWF2_38_335]|nr:MAG: 16S rRNA (uracil(1498)-N(3))-methyltransferase [Bacteroidetes bacterium GWF2_38_335]OFY81902.1 MAG: 16S rRNA (uracil(1498)-N(3))-methyltransferase [Bacteroidetes bacterium RIFOXYA12_FULL_38_20]HBS87982.1 16S rRNA (uracil(1498)-N(3))-methyltransferase [Bacteroidales bacterium]